jgi:hypothetical protein
MRLLDGASMAPDARLSGRGGGDPKRVSAGGGPLVIAVLEPQPVLLPIVEGAVVEAGSQSGIVRLRRVTKSVILVTALSG